MCYLGRLTEQMTDYLTGGWWHGRGWVSRRKKALCNWGGGTNHRGLGAQASETTGEHRGKLEQCTRGVKCLFNPFTGNLEIGGVSFYADEVAVSVGGSYAGCAGAKEWVKHNIPRVGPT